MKALLVLMVLILVFFGTKHTALARESEDAAQQRAKNAICRTFGEYCRQALTVTWCESRWRIWAKNGQYLGLFQMGEWERRTFGHGPGGWAQARAAWKYFVATGKDWSPWDCKPW